MTKKGLLLINLGTPSALTTKAIRQYLRPFLLDKRVITLPAFLRYMLVNGVILPFRPKRLLHTYGKIWTKEGSPLMQHSLALHHALQEKLKESHLVAIAMRYGAPSISDALDKLKRCDSITILPLYPQYASSSSGSAIEAALHEIQKWDVIPNLQVIRDFYKHPSFIDAVSQSVEPYIKQDSFVLFSYHGVPQNHLRMPECRHCETACPSTQDTSCYRAQCFETTRLLVRKLALPEKNHATAFQSRLGKTPWIKPYTDEMLQDLAQRGIKNLVVVCPSFVSDCLETLEEIAIQAKKQWQDLTGQVLETVPCLNANQTFVEAIAHIVGDK